MTTFRLKQCIHPETKYTTVFNPSVNLLFKCIVFGYKNMHLKKQQTFQTFTKDKVC